MFYKNQRAYRSFEHFSWFCLVHRAHDKVVHIACYAIYEETRTHQKSGAESRYQQVRRDEQDISAKTRSYNLRKCKAWSTVHRSSLTTT
jgi:hypothetical protein